MQIAVASQNQRTITGHAGRCQTFWVYEVEQGCVAGKHLLELPADQVLRGSAQPASVFSPINVLICGGMGPHLYQRLMQQGVLPVITAEDEPDQAVAAFLANELERFPPLAGPRQERMAGCAC